jgi:hypothetical protein
MICIRSSTTMGYYWFINLYCYRLILDIVLKLLNKWLMVGRARIDYTK